ALAQTADSSVTAKAISPAAGRRCFMAGNIQSMVVLPRRKTSSRQPVEVRAIDKSELPQASEVDRRGLGRLRETLIHIRFISDRRLDRAGRDGKLHQLLELLADHAQIAVGNAVRRILHDEPDDVRILVEIL